MVAVSIKKNFFKQKTAYEMRVGLVGSEMCIRDSSSLSLSVIDPSVDREAGRLGSLEINGEFLQACIDRRRNLC